MSWNRLGLVMIALSVLCACKETTSSGNIRTAGIAMTVEVRAQTASASVVTATLQVGGNESNTYVVLDQGDGLFAKADGKRKEMQSIDDGVYEAKFSIADEDTLFAVMLERDQDEDASDNSGRLPAPFEITSSFSDPLSRADDPIKVTWEPSGKDGDMALDIEDEAGGCIAFDEHQNIGGDPGSYTVPKGTLESQDEEKPETCDATLTLERARDGKTDSAFDSESSFVLKQIRSDTFASAP